MISGQRQAITGQLVLANINMFKSQFHVQHCGCTCPICFQLFSIHTAGDVANGNAGMQLCIIRRLGFVDAIAVTDGEDVGESFDLQVFVDLQRSAIGHVIRCGDKGMDVITQNTLLLSIVIQDVQFIPSEFRPHGVAIDSRG